MAAGRIRSCGENVILFTCFSKLVYGYFTALFNMMNIQSLSWWCMNVISSVHFGKVVYLIYVLFDYNVWNNRPKLTLLLRYCYLHIYLLSICIFIYRSILSNINHFTGQTLEICMQVTAYWNVDGWSRWVCNDDTKPCEEQKWLMRTERNSRQPYAHRPENWVKLTG